MPPYLIDDRIVYFTVQFNTHLWSLGGTFYMSVAQALKDGRFETHLIYPLIILLTTVFFKLTYHFTPNSILSHLPIMQCYITVA